MAKLPPRSTGPHQPLQRMVRSFHGRIIIAEGPQGVQVRSWPRKRGSGGTPAQMTARAEFAAMAKAVQDMLPADKVAAHDIAIGTVWTWRDVLSRAAAGRLITFMGSTLVDIQEALDTISQLPGAILMRVSGGWAALLPGTDEQVLTLDGGLPAWKPSAGGGGGALNVVRAQLASDLTISPTPIGDTVLTGLTNTVGPFTADTRVYTSCSIAFVSSHCRVGIRLDGGSLLLNSGGVFYDSDGQGLKAIAMFPVLIPGDGATHAIEYVISAQGSTAGSTAKAGSSTVTIW